MGLKAEVYVQGREEGGRQEFIQMLIIVQVGPIAF